MLTAEGGIAVAVDLAPGVGSGFNFRNVSGNIICSVDMEKLCYDKFVRET